MKAGTFQQLKQIRGKFGAGIFGKIAQKLLALAFHEVGYSHVVERGVQGADIDVVSTKGNMYTLEAKTTDKDSVPISKENMAALEDRVKDGYMPVIAVLRMQMFEDWIFANIPLDQLRPGSIPISRLRSYRITELESMVRPAFEIVVNQHFSDVLAKGEYYLRRVLEQKRQEHQQH